MLNLATLLGLGLGVDYSLLMTSRFREELANRDGPDRVAEAVRVTVATAGRAVFFSGLTVLLGLLGPRPVRVHDPALGRDRGGHRRGPRGGLGAHAAAGDPGGRRDADRPAGRATGHDHAGRRRAVGAARAAGHAPPGRRPRADAVVPAPARRPVPARPVQRPRLDDPARRRSRPGRRYDILAREFGEGEFAPLALAIRTTGDATTPANVAKLYDYSRRLEADPRISRVVSLVDVDPRLTLAQYQLLYAAPGGPPDRFVATALGATTKGDLTAFTVYTRVRTEPRRRPGAGPRAPRPGRPARAARRASRCWSAAAPPTSTTSCRACGRTSRGPRCSSS